MEALKASYGSSSDSEFESSPPRTDNSHKFSNSNEVVYLPPPPLSLLDLPPTSSESNEVVRLPPPPLSLLDPPHTSSAYSQVSQGNRVRIFPHVEGNYALHVFVPVQIASIARKELIPLVRKVASLVPSLHAVDIDIPLRDFCLDDQNLDQILLGREFHISLSRTVPIRVHQIDSVVTMLRQKLQAQRRYWIEFSKWEVFVNDDQTRSFLSMEVTTGGLSEITKQIQAVNEVYRRHNLPEFYKNPRPHVSLAWALGDISHSLKQAVDNLNGHHPNASFMKKNICACRFDGIECKIGEVLPFIGSPWSTCFVMVVMVANPKNLKVLLTCIPGSSWL